MRYSLRFTEAASAARNELQRTDERRYKKVNRTLGRIEEDPRHPGLQSHQYESFPLNPKDTVWESYVENRVPSAWRIFWMYGPDSYDESGNRSPVITILAITRHP